MTSFSDLGLIEPLHRAVSDSGYTEPTPIQALAIPHLLEGRDLLGCARTGTGKTAAFALPILQRLAAAGRGGSSRERSTAVRALVLVPTRELAAQVAESFRTYGRRLHLTAAVVHGGVGQGPQVRALARGVDVLVATPGRLLDLMQQGHARLEHVEVLVLDEADHMLDLGFIPDVRKILRVVPRKRQTLLFSATMPPPISQLADGILSNPAKVFVTPAATTVDEVEQRVHFVEGSAKADRLAGILSDASVERALVFTRTKRGADRVAKRLGEQRIQAQAIHGNKSQGARERTLDSFRQGRVKVLVATDIAARGLDIDGITHVVNFDLPHVPESYVHRIGRTARAGSTGVAISLCSSEERSLLRDIERLIRRSLTVAEGSANGSGGHVRREPVRGPSVERHRKGHSSGSGRAPYQDHGPKSSASRHPGRGHRGPGSSTRPGPERSGPARSGPTRSGGHFRRPAPPASHRQTRPVGGPHETRGSVVFGSGLSS